MSDIRVCTICSGSSANAVYIEIDSEALLIDAGCNLKSLSAFLNGIGSSFEKIKAVFITHEHSDHIKGVASLTKRNIPIIANQLTLDNIRSLKPDADTSLFRIMPTGFLARNGKFSVLSFRTSHDAAESVGYVIKTEKGDIGIVTDLGFYDERTVNAVKNCRVLFVESNHDEDMLWNGRYPYPLKRRISGNTGHLSNTQCGNLLKELGDENLEYAVLSHLSSENNTPQKALSVVSSYLSEKVKVTVAPRSEPSEFIVL